MIEVTADELAIIDTPVLQRLRGIRQLALTNLVYPGAEHTRFGHVLGTMHVAGQIFDAIRSERDLNGEETTGWEEKRRLVRLAALVHDVGHAPFSHAAEDLLFPKDYKHEQVGAALVRSDDHLGKVIRVRYGDAAVEFIAAILDPKQGTSPQDQWLASIVSGPLDADKLDYLLRDSRYCGVTYGLYDYDRLLSKLVLRHAPSPEGSDAGEKTESFDQVVVTIGGLQAAESVFVARYWMFVQVYYHAVRRQLDLMLGRFIRSEVLSDKNYPIEDLTAYLKWTDARVLAALEAGDGPWARRLKSPRPYFALIAEQEPEQGQTGKRLWYKLVVEEINKEFGPDSAFYDGPPLKTDVTYPTRGAAEQMVEPSEGQFASIRKKSDFVEALAKTEDNRRYSPRIFALKEHEKRAKQIYSTYSDKMEEK